MKTVTPLWRALTDQSLRLSEKVVFAGLVEMVLVQPQRSKEKMPIGHAEVAATVLDISNLLGLSERSVSCALRALNVHGFIKIHRRNQYRNWGGTERIYQIVGLQQPVGNN